MLNTHKDDQAIFHPTGCKGQLCVSVLKQPWIHAYAHKAHVLDPYCLKLEEKQSNKTVNKRFEIPTWSWLSQS